MTFAFTYLKVELPANSANQLTAAKDPPTAISELAALATNADEATSESAAADDRQARAWFKRRDRRFKDLRLHDHEALAERLAARDRDLDDRTLCIECSHFRGSGCARRSLWLPRQLQRCEFSQDAWEVTGGQR